MTWLPQVASWSRSSSKISLDWPLSPPSPWLASPFSLSPLSPESAPGSFSGTALMSPRAASVPIMAEETMTPSASSDLAVARSFSVVLTTVKSEPVWACHSPRSRPAALASAGSPATRRRNATPAKGSAAGGVAGWESGRGQPAVASSKQPTAKQIAPVRGGFRGSMAYSTRLEGKGSCLGR